MKDKYYEEYRNLGVSIAYFRKMKGLTQEQLAEKMNVNSETISRIENANTGMSLDTVFVLCEALGISLGELFSHAHI